MVHFYIFFLLPAAVVGGLWDSITIDPPITEPLEETAGSTPSGLFQSIRLDLPGEQPGEESTSPPFGGLFDSVTIDPPGFFTVGPSPARGTEKPEKFSNTQSVDSSRASPSIEGKLNALLVIGALLLTIAMGQLYVSIRKFQASRMSLSASEGIRSTEQHPEDCTCSPASKEHTASVETLV
ncbi:hypothetical protein FOL47_005405 [Perkinsus chesapeaki]|uniref:Uncharacterized protein n=1 Tax=Perkinsus chesapeaki TaxID=330153 RepID=A0A7J6N314_PERCH|nr:hypothetical protein FOL47_005405 [Perkinsus chesapeaki]